MIPQRFEQSNIVMQRPKGMTQEQCADVHAFKGRYPNGLPVVLTAWRPTPEDLVRLNLGEPVWLSVIGHTMPPVSLFTESPFVQPAAEEAEPG